MSGNWYASYPVNSGSGGVTSLNGQTGALTLVAGTNITLTPGAGTLTIDASGTSGANTALSNLAATAVNANIIPGSDSTLNLGSSSLRWNFLYGRRISSDGTNGITLSSAALLDNSGNQSVKYNTRELLKSDGSTISIDWNQQFLVTGATTKLDWSGTNLSVNTRKITNLVDPTAAQDAATKNYVDGLVGSGSRVVELRTITAPEAAAEALTLAATPTTANYTVVEPAGGGNQFYGDDFTVSGAVLSWATLGLSGILATGDKLTITYN